MTNVRKPNKPKRVTHVKASFQNQKPLHPESKNRKNAREQQKDLRKERREKKEGFSIITSLKKDWEELRQKKITKEKRAVLLKGMMKAVKGQIQDLIFKHDASRIIQAMVKYGTLEDRELICNELKGHIAKLATSTYGKFLILSLLKYYKPLRQTIAQEFYGKMTKLMKHSIAASLIEEIYSDWLNTKQARYHLYQEMYHPEFYNFKTDAPLSELIQTRSVTSIQENLMDVIRPCIEKGILGPLTLVQRAVLDYLSISSEALQQNLLTELHPVLVSIVHQKEGSLVAMRAISRGLPKDRKSILKLFKPYIMKMADNEYGFRVLIQALDTVDDVVLLEKSILRELDVMAISTPSYVTRVFRFLLTGRTSRAFPDTFLELLEQQGKKDPCVRYFELLQLVCPLLHPVMSKHLITWLTTPSLVPFVLDYLSRTPEALTYATLLLEVLQQETSVSHAPCLYTSVQKLIKYVYNWDKHVQTDTVAEGYTAEGRTQLRERLLENHRVYTSTFIEHLSADRWVSLALASSEASFMVLALCEVDSPLKAKVLDQLLPYTKDFQGHEAHGCQLIFQTLQQYQETH
ncbi:hypothetical protein HMI54_011107 [Coelomomyces lativittatus]|nr:hypothetical protein HMI55_006771 [Coelomomyces lativittatus]KAJ1511208.1 hypothetical protein HMI56_005683 [Coelomomyces lativittatus]KAJ1516037.1 hypothetical protein HMI54_011107 [Coelomomyces lativittatus]